MLIVEIDQISPQSLKDCLDDTLDALGSAIECDRAVDGKAELRRNRNLVANAL